MSDLISRQEAIAIATQEGAYGYISAQELADMPSAERTGKWINYRCDDEHHIADCSECGNTLQWYDDEGGHNYCPNCGCRMEGEEE